MRARPSSTADTTIARTDAHALADTRLRVLR